MNIINWKWEWDRTIEQKKETAKIIQQQAEIEAIMWWWKIWDNIEWLIRDKWNIRPEYREELEADVAIARQRDEIRNSMDAALMIRDVTLIKGLTRPIMEFLEKFCLVNDLDSSESNNEIYFYFLWKEYRVLVTWFSKVEIHTNDEEVCKIHREDILLYIFNQWKEIKWSNSYRFEPIFPSNVSNSLKTYFDIPKTMTWQIDIDYKHPISRWGKVCLIFFSSRDNIKWFPNVSDNYEMGMMEFFQILKDNQ